MFEQEYSIPQNEYTEQKLGEVSDVNPAQPSLGSVPSVEAARAEVSRNYADVLSPELVFQLEVIVIIGQRIARARQHQQDGEPIGSLGEIEKLSLRP